MFKFDVEDIELSLIDKIKKIDNLFIEAFELSKNPLLLFSGGSDSLLMLHFALERRPDINVLFIDMQMNYPSFNKFLEEEIKPKVKNFIHKKIEVTEEEYVEKYGIPLHIELSRLGFDKDKLGNIGANKACSVLKEKVMKEVLEEIKPDMTIIGLLATDNESRLKRIKENGYLRLKYGENLFTPIAMLKKEEVFKILDEFKFPYIKDIYFDKKTMKLYRGDGVCWMCPVRAFTEPDISGWKLLQINHPELWEKLKKYGAKERLEELYNITKNNDIKEAIERYFKDE